MGLHDGQPRSPFSAARRQLLAWLPLALAGAAATPVAQAAGRNIPTLTMTMSMTTDSLSASQLALLPMAAFTASGDLARLDAALRRALDTGLTVSQCREVLVQLYAYAGFPRSLNALGVLMNVLADRRQRGIKDEPGSEPGPAPMGEELLAIGTANQTTLAGMPVRGPVFDFAPAIDRYLKTHLFGDIFWRDNLDWRSRELATLGALAVVPGLEPQLLAHMRISMNVGLDERQLAQAADFLARAVDEASGARARQALAQASPTGKR